MKMTDMKVEILNDGTEQGIIAEWKASPALRAEFHDDPAAFAAYCQNKQHAKVLESKKQ